MAASNTAARPGGGQVVLNWVMRGVLATPLLHRAISNRVLVLDVRGRKTGRRYRIPVGYTPHDGELLIGTAGRWRRNLDPNRPVDAVVARRRLAALPEIITDEDRCATLYGVILAHNPVHGRYAGIGHAADGTPDRGDLRRALANGIAVVRLRPIPVVRADTVQAAQS